MSAEAISGTEATVQVGTCEFMLFEAFDLQIGPDTQPYNARAGAGWEQSVAGVKRASGTISGFVDTSEKLTNHIVPGASVTLTLRAKTGREYTGTARLGQFGLSANRDGTPQPVSIPFNSNGPWTVDGNEI